jgi:purine nucleosidase
MHTIILDTDIGSDVDDALALAMLLGSDSIDFLGITTVYGDTKLRAQIAAHLCHLANRSIQVFAGLEEPLSGREVWISGSEGKALSNLDQYAPERKSAVDFLVETVSQNPGQIEVIAIGPLSNIASAIQQEESFATNVKQLWIMGGDFTKEKIEHNFKCDVTAAKIVLESNMSITILDLPSSQKTIIKKDEIEKIKSSGKLGPTLHSEILNWIQPRQQDWTTPHDPIAVLAMLAPEFFDFSENGSVKIDENGLSEWCLTKDGNVKKISPSLPSEAVNAMISLIAKVV